MSSSTCRTMRLIPARLIRALGCLSELERIRMEAWYIQWPERLKKEQYEMTKRFPKLRLHTLEDGRLVWLGSLELSSGRSFQIAIVYPQEFPRISPRAYPIDPDFLENAKEVPHKFDDGSLCLSYPAFNSPSATAADIATGAFIWLEHFDGFADSGTWRGRPPDQILRLATPAHETKKRNKVFISYSHVDAPWLQRLQIHLKPLEREGLIEIWDDTRIKTGEIWRQEIRNAIDSAKVAVLLISADFLASEFIQTNELPPLLATAEERGAIVLPIIVGPSRFLQFDSLSRFQAANSPTTPLSSMSRNDQEQVFVKLSLDIEAALNERYS